MLSRIEADFQLIRQGNSPSGDGSEITASLYAIEKSLKIIRDRQNRFGEQNLGLAFKRVESTIDNLAMVVRDNDSAALTPFINSLGEARIKAEQFAKLHSIANDTGAEEFVSSHEINLHEILILASARMLVGVLVAWRIVDAAADA